MMYGKIINNTLSIAPRSVTIGQTHYNPAPLSWLAENGYKPVRYTDEPEQEGYYAVPSWTETDDEIVQEWNLVQVSESDEATPEEIEEALEGIL